MAETKMQLVDWLDDLCVRFIINLPHEELTSVERICFQIEEAQWFYEDFIRAHDPQMPQMNLRRFCELIFQHCPLLAPFQASAALSYAEFLAYKTRVPVRGAILLNEDMSEVVLVKGWSKKAKWSFPRGKINKEEKDLDCAIREVYEETGYDVRDAGLVDDDEDAVKYIDMSLREQQMRLYVFRDVPMDTYFEPKTRKEISKIDWFKVSELAATGNQKHLQQQHNGPPVSQDALKSSQFYMVAPFIRPLRQWIKQQRKQDQHTGRKAQRVAAEESEAEGLHLQNHMVYDDGMMTTDAEDNGHFQRLLSGLQQQHAEPEPIPLPETAPAASTADLSAELKRMLSVGAPVAPVPQPAGGNPLMNILLGKQQGPVAHIPHTPLEQITSTPPQAHTPHHHHPRPPPYSEVPPPAFPLSPPHAHHGPPPPHHHGPPPPPHWQGPPQPFHGQLPPMPPPHAGMHPPGPPPGPQQRGLFGTNIPAPPPTQISNPLQTGDPAFRSQFPQYNQPSAAPPMPKPAPQKLTNHAINLLNVFKSPNTTAAQPVQPVAQAPPAQLPELADQSKPLLPSQLLGGAHNMPDSQPSPPPIHQPQAQKPRSSHQDSLLNLFRASATPAAPQNEGLPVPAAEPIELSAQPSPHMPREIAKPVQHKLSMRRLPNVNTAIESPKNQTPHLTSATVSGPLNAPDFETVRKNQPQRPVELGIASPSPGTVPPPGFHPSAIMQRPGSGIVRQATATPPVPVHTVSNTTPMEAPRPFHPTSILRKSAQDIADMAQAHGQAMAKQPTPAQPEPPTQQSPPAPRQQQHRGSTGGGGAQLPNFDRRGDGAPSQHKNALLNLFAGGGPASGVSTTASSSRSDLTPATASQPVSALPPGYIHGHGHARAGGIGSPVSPLPPLSAAKRQDTADSLLLHHPHSLPLSNETPRSSRISSLNSAPGELLALGMPGGVMMPTAAAAAGGAAGAAGLPSLPLKSKPTPPVKRGSVVNDAPGAAGVTSGGTQSPITPVEKNFLLGYLQGVVTKENQARALQQQQGGGGPPSRQGTLR